MKKQKILIYSDCYVFSGSEMMIENFLRSDVIAGKYELLFYYAFNKVYDKEVKKRFYGLNNVHPVKIFSAFSKWGYQLKTTKAQKISFKFFYLWLRYLSARIFQQAGLYDVYNVWKLYKLFKKELPDIIYINNGGYPGARSCRMAVFSAKLAKVKKVIFTVHNLALPQRSFADKWIDRHINNYVSVFTTPANAAISPLIHLRNISAAKCVAIPNTLSLKDEASAFALQGCMRREFKIYDNEFIIGAVGLLSNRKGFDILIEAAKILKHKEINNFKLYIFGEGEQRALLEAKIKEYKLEEVVVLAGYKTGMLNYMKDFDLLVCSSVANEVLPYVILEAILLRKPVIATSIAGIPDQIIDSYNGFLVPPGNAALLAKGIEKLLLNKKLAFTMGENGYMRYASNFNNQYVMNLYCALFDSVSSDNQNVLQHNKVLANSLDKTGQKHLNS